MNEKPRYRVRAGRVGCVVVLRAQTAEPLEALELMAGVVRSEGSRAIAICTVNRDGSVSTYWRYHQNANIHELAGAIARLAFRFQQESME